MGDKEYTPSKAAKALLVKVSGREKAAQVNRENAISNYGSVPYIGGAGGLNFLSIIAQETGDWRGEDAFGDI